MNQDILDAGATQVICASVNDSFVMNSWAEKVTGIEKTILLPDGNLDYTEAVGQAVEKRNLGFGMRAWRSVQCWDGRELVGQIEEVDKVHNSEPDPYEVLTYSSFELLIKYQKEDRKRAKDQGFQWFEVHPAQEVVLKDPKHAFAYKLPPVQWTQPGDIPEFPNE